MASTGPGGFVPATPVALADTLPVPEAVSPVAGAMVAASRGDHVHQRLVSATVQTLDANSEATVTFTRSFSVLPAFSFSYLESATAQPVIFKVKSLVQTGPLYTGCVVRAYRTQTLPAVLTLLTALLNYDIAAGSAAGVQFSCIAIQVSN